MTRRSEGGFTLIELMVTVAIVAILSAIAYPSYVEQVAKSRRAEGRSAILQTSAQLERYYTMNNAYVTTLAAPSTKYTIVITIPVADTFLITATPFITDAKCANLTYDHLGTKGFSGTGTVADCW
ncbi:type IV pilin protein [Actimicrobium antarcticum]|uniref:Type IV pilin protein n=1 Tax=Actimicrobium antarcticum TaxID=1051899 RepID=A0ABP7T1U9_9BURK